MVNRNLIFATWSWVVISVLLEIEAAYNLSAVMWYVRGAVEGLLAFTAVIPLMLVYMGLWHEHLSLKMFVVVSLFFCADLVLIWSASVVH
jgi:hypothetical protein